MGGGCCRGCDPWPLHPLESTLELSTCRANHSPRLPLTLASSPIHLLDLSEVKRVVPMMHELVRIALDLRIGFLPLH